jgi:hypothetical protein
MHQHQMEMKGLTLVMAILLSVHSVGTFMQESIVCLLLLFHQLQKDSHTFQDMTLVS